MLQNEIKSEQNASTKYECHSIGFDHKQTRKSIEMSSSVENPKKKTHVFGGRSIKANHYYLVE